MNIRINKSYISNIYFRFLHCMNNRMNMTKSKQNHFNWKSLNNVRTDSPKDVFDTEHINDITTSKERFFIIPLLSFTSSLLIVLLPSVSFSKQRLSVFSLISLHLKSSVPSQKQVANLPADSCLMRISREFLHLLEHFPPLNMSWQFLL